MRARTIRLCLAVVVICCWAYAAANAQTASGTINATLINKSGISLVFNSNPSGVKLSGAGSYAATLDFGTVAMYGTTAAAGATLTRTSTDFTLTSPFNIRVDKSGTTSNSYRLQAAMAAPAGVYTCKVDGITLPTTLTTIVANDPGYGADVPHTLSLTIPASAPAGALTLTINFTATSN